MPQDEAARPVVEDAGKELAHERALERPGNPGAVLWHVRSGEMLRAVISRWGDRAGVEVQFLTDRRYRLHEGRTFRGSFEEAAEALFAALSQMPHPPVGEMRQVSRTLVVLHSARPDRARTVGDGQ